MKSRSTIFGMVAILVAIFCLWLTIPQKSLFTDVAPTNEQQNKASSRARLASSAPASDSTVSSRINPKDFAVLQLDLPEPEDKPWPGPFWNSSNFRSPETAKAALEVLPIWIRNAVLDGHKDQAGKFLFSLLAYLDEKDDRLRFDAALIIYKLGSKDERMINVLRTEIESGGDRSASSSLIEGGSGISRRAAILEHLRFYSDHSLDDYIELVFDKLPEKGPFTQSGDYNLKVLELATYLESVGRPREDSFWLTQIQLGGDLAKAVNVLSKRKSIDLPALLRTRFAAEPEATPMATVAASLVYGMTSDKLYEPMLLKIVEESVQAGSPAGLLELALQGLLKGNSSQAEADIKRVLASENQVLQWKALEALSHVPGMNSIQKITEYARPIIGKELIPTAAFKALIEMNIPEADAAYSTLRSEVLARDGRSEVDFYALDFEKTHRSKLD